MLVFYETLPESVVQITGNSNSMVSIDSCIFSNGVDITEESSGLSIIFYIFNTVQDKFDVSKCNIVTRRSLEYVPHTYQLQRLMFKIAGTDWGKNRFYFPNNFLVTNHTNPIGAHNLPKAQLEVD